MATTKLKDLMLNIQQYNQTITGITTAPNKFEDYPRSQLDNGNLPLALTYIGDSEIRPKTINCFYDFRNVTIRVFVATMGQGVGQEHILTTADLIDNFIIAYSNKENPICKLDGIRIITTNPSLSDSGYLENMFYLNDQYVGFEFDFQIERKVEFSDLL